MTSDQGERRTLLAGRTALVTGGSRGIGAAVARGLGQQGARVWLVARSEEALRRTARELGMPWLVADVSDADSVERLRASITDQLGGAPDIVVNAAGAFALVPIARTSVEQFDRQIAVNLRGVFLVIRAFLPDMLARRSGQVITIGSIAGRQAFPANGAYAASKFGVRGLHAVLHAELRGTGVRATLVEPAATDTELWAEVDRVQHPGLPAAEAMLKPEIVAQAVLYAASQPAEVTVPNLLVERG